MRLLICVVNLFVSHYKILQKHWNNFCLDNWGHFLFLFIYSFIYFLELKSHFLVGILSTFACK